MRYLVTGGMGFLGSNLCAALIGRGDEVICVDSGVIGVERNIEALKENKRFRIEFVDVCNKFDCGEVDGIFHLASPTAPAETYKHPEMTLEVNSMTTLAMIAMAEKYSAKMLFASSIKVNDRQTFNSTYIQGKILGENFCREAKFVKVARMGNIYGPGMAANDSRVIPTFIRATIKNCPLNVWGDGSQVDSFCYASDAVSALIAFMDSAYDGVMEIGSSQPITILDLAFKVLSVNNCDLPIIFDQPGGAAVVVCENLTYENNRTIKALAAKSRKVPDTTLAEIYLKWKPRVTLADGIWKTTEYYKSILRSA